MRSPLFVAIADAADQAPPLWFLTGDLGFGQVDPIREALGGRYLNLGVAEQNLASVACGLALAGQRVVTYSIGPFALIRAADQIRSGVVAHNLDVSVVCGGAGLSYGTLGYSHFALEDVALARSLGVTVLAPTTQAELDMVIERVLGGGGPRYLRLERQCCEGAIVSLADAPLFGRVQAVIVGYGAVMGEAVAAAERLRARGIQVEVLSVPVMDGQTSGLLAGALAEAETVVTVEEHARHGGVGSIVAGVLATSGLPAQLRILATDGSVRNAWGSTPYVRKLQQLDSDSIVAAVTSLAIT